MSNIIGSSISKFVCASIATAMTGILAWMVSDSTTTGPRYDVAATQIVVSHQFDSRA